MACNVNINSHPSYHVNFEQQFKRQTTTKVVHTLKQVVIKEYRIH